MPSKSFVVKSGYERIVVGEVYAPGQLDAHGNVMSEEEIKKSCYNFMQHSRGHNIDLMHNEEPTGSYIVETFIARKDDPDGFAEGSWVVSTKIESDVIWDRILKGEINGYSLSGLTNLDRRVDIVDVPVEASGETSENLDELVPPHTHSYDIKFDADRSVVPVLSSETLGHSHKISAYSVTDEAFGHTHRYTLEINDASYT